MIDYFVQLDKSHKIISIWMAAERVFEAGVIWVAYLSRQRNVTPMREDHITSIGTNIAASPILKVSTLLASIAARWKRGLVYVNTWETLVQLLWNIL